MENNKARRGNTQNNTNIRVGQVVPDNAPAKGHPSTLIDGINSLYYCQVQPDLHKRHRGFTLIELLVVVLIVGILAAVALPQYQLAVEKSRTTGAITQLKALATAENAYYLANGEYTTDWNDLDIKLEGEVDQTNTLHQKTLYFSLYNAKDTPSRLYAAPQGTSYKEGLWYIGYRLNTNELYCAAYKTDARADRVCKTFGEGYTCPHDTQLNCYPIP